jgi:hypothetical protein
MLRIAFSLVVFSLFFACSEDNTNPGTSSNSSQGKGNLALPSNAISREEIKNRYNQFMEAYYVTYEEDLAAGLFNTNTKNDAAEGSARIRWSTPNKTVSEGIGYGMLLAALNDDWERFDKLWKYNKAFRIAGTALMKWEINNFKLTVPGEACATDADIDILASLIIAYKRTDNENYLNDAKAIGNSLYSDALSSGKLLLPAPTYNTLGKGDIFNISYISLAAMKMLSAYDDRWNAVIDANINYMQMVQDKGLGLFPDWSDLTGEPKDPKANTGMNCQDRSGMVGRWTTESSCQDRVSGTSTVSSCFLYDKEGVRIPLRLAWYYHWFGDERAKDMLNKAYNFISNRTCSNQEYIRLRYGFNEEIESSNGDRIGWMSLCATGLVSADNSAWNEACNARFLESGVLGTSGNTNTYFSDGLYMLYLMLFNGGFEW